MSGELEFSWLDRFEVVVQDAARAVMRIMTKRRVMKYLICVFLFIVSSKCIVICFIIYEILDNRESIIEDSGIG